MTDSDGLTNSTFADVTVIREVDYPPKANAGSNVILSLPHNSVTLYGNKSTDDKGIASYEWIKHEDSLTADMQVCVCVCACVCVRACVCLRLRACVGRVRVCGLEWSVGVYALVCVCRRVGRIRVCVKFIHPCVTTLTIARCALRRPSLP